MKKSLFYHIEVKHNQEFTALIESQDLTAMQRKLLGIEEECAVEVTGELEYYVSDDEFYVKSFDAELHHNGVTIEFEYTSKQEDDICDDLIEECDYDSAMVARMEMLADRAYDFANDR